MNLGIETTATGMVPGSGLLFGLMLVAAIVGGYAARWVHVPRVVGFLVGGVVLRRLLEFLLVPDGGGLPAHALHEASVPLKAIQDLALGLILFTIGSVFERSQLKASGRHVLKISLVEIGLVTVLVFVGCAVVALLTQREVPPGETLILALLLALLAIASAPAATLFVLQEYDAKGPITDTILGVIGVKNAVCIVLFHATFFMLAAVGKIEAGASLSKNLVMVLTATVAGSVALGILCGTLISVIHAKLPLADTVLIFFALFILLGAGEQWLLEQVGLSYNFLLTTLVIGAIFANIALDSQKLAVSLRTMGSPIFAGFFVMAGYNLHLNELVHMGWLGGAYIVTRAAGKIVGGQLGVRWAKAPARAEGRLGTALLCQGAVVIGLASFVAHNWDSPLAAQFTTVAFGGVVVFELIGPLLVKRVVVQGGEVKAISLLRRGGQTAEGGGILRLTIRSLLRLFGIRRQASSSAVREMQVKDIMRTNVQFIHVFDALDDVLQFIERSTYNHFTVIDEKDEFAGVIHFSDVRDVIYDPVLRDLVTAADLADWNATVVPMEMTLNELLSVFTRENVGVLPVVEQPEHRHIVGVVEQRDLLRTLHLSRLSQ